jgi:hypothetical protein
MKFTTKEELRRWHLEQADECVKKVAECNAAFKKAHSALERAEIHAESEAYFQQAQLHESAAEVLK